MRWEYFVYGLCPEIQTVGSCTSEFSWAAGGEVKWDASAGSSSRKGVFGKPHLSRGEGNGNPLQYSCLENPMDGRAWWAAVHGVGKSRTWLSDFTFTFHFHSLEKEMATHSSVLAWRIPGTAEPSGLLSMGLHRIGHDWSDLAAAAAAAASVSGDDRRRGTLSSDLWSQLTGYYPKSMSHHPYFIPYIKIAQDMLRN